MKTQVMTLAVWALALAMLGCGPGEAAPGTTDTVAEGVIFSVTYLSKDGRTKGFTRLNVPGTVPADEGSWNIDAHGRLTRDYLFITRPQLRDMGPKVIPTSRLLDVQFGDGGIKEVNEGQSNAAN